MMKSELSTSAARGALSPAGVATILWAACAVVPTPAMAQQQGSPPQADDRAQTSDSETIVVTARRREESIQDVPQSVVAVSGRQLEQAQVDSVDELSRLVPDLVFIETNAGGSGGPTNSVSIRGIGTTNGAIGIDPTVGTVIDGAVMGYTNAFSQDYLDIARVEVLRGPQGTLFGKNSSGGLMSIVTQDPTEDLTGTISAGYGDYDETKIRGTLSGPIFGSELLGRVSFYDNESDGNVFDRGSNTYPGGDEQRGVRGIFSLSPTDATRFRLSLYSLDRHYVLTPTPVRLLGPASSMFDVDANGDIAGPENDQVNLPTPETGAFDTNYWGAIFQADQDIGDFTLTSISSYMEWSWDQFQTGFFGTTSLVITFPFDDRLWSQEFRLASPTGGTLDYQVGVYAYHEDHSTSPTLDALTDTGLQLTNAYTQAIETLNYAAFGEANLHLSDELTLIAGARWTHEEKDMLLEAFAPPPGAIGLAQSATPGVTQDSVEAENVSWRVGAQWRPLADQMIYATASRGFKGPGFGDNSQQGVSQEVEPEVATSYEIGWKSSWMDGRLDTELTFYHTTFDEYQVGAYGFVRAPDGSIVTLPSGDPISTFILQNAGEVLSQGAEFSAYLQATDQLSLTFRGAYVDANYERYEGAPCYPGQADFGTGCSTVDSTQNLSGTRMPAAPRFTGNVGANYELELAAFNANLHADYSWRDDVQWSSGGAPQGIEPSYGQLNASIELTDKDERVSFIIFGKNLTDEFHTSGFSNAGFGTVTQSLPFDYQTIYGATLRYRF